MPGLSIGELARRTGVHIETIRYFEKVGLLDTPGRTAGGHRIYAERHVRRLSFIKRARELGFTPKEVRALLNLGGPGNACCDEVRAIAVQHLDQVRRKIADLAAIERLLATMVERCSGGDVAECPVIELIEDRDQAPSSPESGPVPVSR